MTRLQRWGVLRHFLILFALLGALVTVTVLYRNTALFGICLAGVVAATIFIGGWVWWYATKQYLKFGKTHIVERVLEETGLEDIEFRPQGESWSVGLDCPYGRRRVLIAFRPAPAKGMSNGSWLGVSSPVILRPESMSMELMCYAASLSMQYGYGTLSSLLMLADPTGGPSILAAISWCEVDGLTANELLHRVTATAHLADIATSVFAGKVKNVGAAS
jgi:hypothetical protein